MSFARHDYDRSIDLDRHRRHRGPRTKSGPVTGARLVLILLELDENDIGVPVVSLSTDLGMEESYIRRICKRLEAEGILISEEVRQAGTPPVKLYRLRRRY